jgi:hypothetical protein
MSFSVFSCLYAILTVADPLQGQAAGRGAVAGGGAGTGGEDIG